MPIKQVTKTVLKKGMKKQEPSFTHFSEAEKDRLRRLQDEGKSPSKVAELLGRDLSSVNRHFKRNMLPPKKLPKPVGRPPALTEKQIDRVVDTAESLSRNSYDRHNNGSIYVASALALYRETNRTNRTRTAPS